MGSENGEVASYDEELSDGSKTENDNVGGKGNDKAAKAGFFQLFRFATPREQVMLVLATACSIAHGVVQPLTIIVSST